MNPDTNPQVAPHPDCQDCLRIVHDRATYHVDRDPDNHNFSPYRNHDWSASTVFHSHCNTCARREEAETQLCSSCRHLSLPHLSFCLGVDDQPSMIPIPEPHPESVESCPLCQVFDAIAKGEQSAATKPLKYPLYISATKWRGREVQWRVRGRNIFSFADDGCAFVVVHEAGILGSHGEVGYRQHVPDIIDDWGPLRGVIDECAEMHHSCSGARVSSMLPPNFRVLDIKNSRITTLPASADYLALSYVWAQAEDGLISSTTTENIMIFSNYVDVSVLPATVQDAITVCERLEERYLWVDRYCIIQDDDEDRASQIRAMAEVFSAAKMVIVVANSGYGITGVSQPRTPQISRILSGCQVDVQRCHMQDAIQPSSWNSRGWTYQEALLNHRKLFFTDVQFYFECARRITHEESLAYPSFDPSLHDKERYIGATTSLSYDDLSHGHERINTGVQRYPREPAWTAYQRHLGRYRRRKLSHVSDLVNAFTGILHALYGKDGVYHGLPLPELDRALLWKPMRTYGPRSRNTRRVSFSTTNADFPSWSWAAAPRVIPNYESTSITHPLCLWFRPIQRVLDPQPSLEPVLPGWVVSRPAPYAEDRYRDSSDVPIYMAKTLTCGLIEQANVFEMDGWEELTFAALREVLRPRWRYPVDFWSEVFGSSQQVRDVESRIRETMQHDTGLSLRDGALVTRAQVARLRVVWATDSAVAGRSAAMAILSEEGEEIGRVTYDQNGRVAKSMLVDRGVLAFVALSVAEREWSVRDEAVPEIAVFRDVEENELTPVPVVNAMVVEEVGGYRRKLGLATIYMRAWTELRAPFETILLI